VLLLWKKTLKRVIKKNIFMHSHTQKIIFSITTRVRSRLSFLENASLLFVSDFLRSHRAHGKEHTQIRKYFFLCFRFVNIAQSERKREYIEHK
jgi:hypothetical protein